MFVSYIYCGFYIAIKSLNMMTMALYNISVSLCEIVMFLFVIGAVHIDKWHFDR